MKTRYYIIDLVSGYAEDITEVSEKEFYNSVHYNWQIAHECKDEVPKFRQMMREFKADKNHEEAFNAFSFLKLTTKSLKQWGYAE